jgi:hypothetical protein
MSTSIRDLPTDPTISEPQNNISLTVSEKPVETGNVSLDQETINQLINGLHRANITGATALQSRDIPQIPSQLTMDPKIQPNYIPEQSRNNYIDEYKKDEYEEEEIMLREKTKQHDRIENMYNEFQTPLLLAVLFFLFQLPFFKKNLFRYIPSLFLKDGNMNVNGFFFTSALFGGLYYITHKIMLQINAFG